MMVLWFNFSTLLVFAEFSTCFSQNSDLFALNSDENLLAALSDDSSFDSTTPESESYWNTKAPNENSLDFSSNPETVALGPGTDSLLDPNLVDLGLTPDQSLDDSLWDDTSLLDNSLDNGQTGLLDPAPNNGPSLGDLADGGDQCVLDSQQPVGRVRPRKPVTCPPNTQFKWPEPNPRTGKINSASRRKKEPPMKPDTLFMMEYGQICPRNPQGREWLDVCGKPVAPALDAQTVVHLEDADLCE